MLQQLFTLETHGYDLPWSHLGVEQAVPANFS